MLYSILVSVDVLIAAALIGLILIQQGKGAGMGAAFGAGASGTVFGARGSGSFLTRMTSILALLFFVNSISLAYLASHRTEVKSVIQSVPMVQENESPEIAPDIPGVINLPEGATAEDMLDIIKQEIANQAESDVPAVEPETSP